MSSRHLVTFFILALGSGLLGSGCSLLLGNVRPMEHKSGDYQFLDLHREDRDWIRLNPADEHQAAELEDPATANDPNAAPSLSDISFQSERTSSIISLSSTCRPRNQVRKGSDRELEEMRLRDYVDQLLQGFTAVEQQQDRSLSVDGRPAHETTLRGAMSGRPMTIRAVVVQERDCIYDLMYIARTHRFAEQEKDFAKFVASFRLN